MAVLSGGDFKQLFLFQLNTFDMFRINGSNSNAKCAPIMDIVKRAKKPSQLMRKHQQFHVPVSVNRSIHFVSRTTLNG
jgi:hypothetical protein